MKFTNYDMGLNITHKDISKNPTDPYRIVPILEEIRRVWGEEPDKSFGPNFAEDY